MLVDSHCHLNFPEFKDDLPDVVRRAQIAGVEVMVSVNTRLNESVEIQKIADQFPFVFCSVGVHPHDAATHVYDGVKEEIRTLCQHPKVVALGETGLDYYYNNSPKEDQIKSFHTHAQLSKELDLPLIIHTRDADEDTIAVLKDHPDAYGVFHCFSGTDALARQALEMGYYLSLSGIVTFPKAQALKEIATWVPLDRLLVETDSPFLAPVPHRGKRNEPAFTAHVAQVLSELKGIPLAEVAQTTTDNFFALFKRAKRP